MEICFKWRSWDPQVKFNAFRRSFSEIISDNNVENTQNLNSVTRLETTDRWNSYREAKITSSSSFINSYLPLDLSQWPKNEVRLPILKYTTKNRDGYSKFTTMKKSESISNFGSTAKHDDRYWWNLKTWIRICRFATDWDRIPHDPSAGRQIHMIE